MAFESIDFVIPWVDGGDAQWQAEKAKYGCNQNCDAEDARYRDFGFLRYWFRGVEKYAPWVNKIHFVTCGHIPEWLNSKHPKLNFVKHSDYIPNEYLPTFNSNAIILNIHRIPDLSENFVLFNDDMFLLKKTVPSDFFVKGIPCDQLLLRNFTPKETHFNKISYNNMKIVNKHFSKQDVINKHIFKFFSLKYGIRRCFVNFLNYRQLSFSDIRNNHTTIAYKKSEFEYVWQIENDLLKNTCSHKFRDSGDVSDWLIRYFRIMKGQFKPCAIIGKYFDIDKNLMKTCEAIRNQKYTIICANDNQIGNTVFEAMQKEISNAFESIFSEKCGWEV